MDGYDKLLQRLIEIDARLWQLEDDAAKLEAAVRRNGLVAVIALTIAATIVIHSIGR